MKNIFFILLISSICYSQIPYDKQLHAIAGGLTSALTYRAVDVNTNKNPLLWAIASAIAIGTIKEVSDSTQPHNKFDTKDLLYTVIGGVGVAFIFDITKRKNRRL